MKSGRRACSPDDFRSFLGVLNRYHIFKYARPSLYLMKINCQMKNIHVVYIDAFIFSPFVVVPIHSYFLGINVVLPSLPAVMYNKTAYTPYDTGKPVPE